MRYFLYRLVRVFLTTMTGILAGEKKCAPVRQWLLLKRDNFSIRLFVYCICYLYYIYVVKFLLPISAHFSRFLLGVCVVRNFRFADYFI